MRSSLLTLPLPLIAACTVHDYFTLPELPELPTAVQVSPDGDDANDGFNMPVRTLKRGIGIATANIEITAIRVAAGRYDAASGETFPYTVPANVTISGPAGGGAILAGTSAEPGLVIGAGELRDLELESFTVAVTANGSAQLTNLRVRSSGTAIRGEAASQLTVTKLDITGTAGACAKPGVELNSDAVLTASEVSTRGLGLAFQIKDQTTASISKANITGSRACGTPSFTVSTTKTFALDESIVDGGADGISFTGTAAPTTATLSDTTLRNMGQRALNGAAGTTVMFTMTGGELSSNGGGGLQAIGGTWLFDNVAFTQNGVSAIYLQGAGATSPSVLAMHGCTITNNATGVYLFVSSVADLGTVANPGNNTFLANTKVGLDLAVCNASPLLTAVGNTWRPNVQGSDAAGKYPVVANVPGPVDPGSGGNFAIATGCTLQR